MGGGKIQKGECRVSKPTGDFEFIDLKGKKDFKILRLVRFIVRGIDSTAQI